MGMIQWNIRDNVNAFCILEKIFLLQNESGVVKLSLCEYVNTDILCFHFHVMV